MSTIFYGIKENLREVLAFLENTFWITDGTFIVIPVPGGEQLAFPGDFIEKQDNGVFLVHGASHLRALE